MSTKFSATEATNKFKPALSGGDLHQKYLQIKKYTEGILTMNYSSKTSFANVIQDKGSDPTLISRRASTISVPSVIVTFNEGAVGAMPNRLTFETVDEDTREGNRVEMRLFYTDSVYQGNGHSIPTSCTFHQWINTHELEQFSAALTEYLANHKAYVKLEQTVEEADKAAAEDSRKSINF